MGIIIDADVPFLCQCGKDILEVNDVRKLSEYSAVSGKLTLSLVNVEQEVTFKNEMRLSAEAVNQMLVKEERVNASYITLSVPFGTDRDSFVESQEVTMTASVAGWSCSSWLAYNGTLLCSIVNSEAACRLSRFESIEIEISEIISCCVPGMTYIKAKFTNINGMEDMVKYIPIEKRKADLQINRFLPEHDRYVISGREQVKLQWKAGAYTEGIIHPVEYILDPRISECVDQPARSVEYTIDVRDDNSNLTQSCPVFVSPPVISEFMADREEKYLSWSVIYATDILLNGSAAEAEKEHCEIPLTWDRAVLYASGYLYDRRRTIYFVKSYQELKELEKEELLFEGYTVMHLLWKSEYVSVTLTIRDPEQSAAVKEKNGEFEYVSEKGTDLTIIFTGQRADGSLCEITL